MKKRNIIIIVTLMLILPSTLIIGRPALNAQNQYYIFGDHSDAIPMLSFNWTNNETYLYPFNESIFYRNETGVSFDLYNADGIGGADGYAGAMSHPHDQDLNTTSNVTFNTLTATLFGDGGNLTNITLYQSGARARLTSIQSVPSGAWTIVALATEDYDLNNDFGSVIAGRFIAPKDGLYSVSYSVHASAIASGKYLDSAIWKNGALAGGYERNIAYTPFGFVDVISSGSDILQLSNTDYLELYVYHNHGSSIVFPAFIYSNYMAVCKIA